MNRLAAVVSLLASSACVVEVGGDCYDCGPSTRFDRVIHTSSNALTIRKGSRFLVGADCDDGVVREMDVETRNGVLRVDSTMFNAPVMDSGCHLVVEAPVLDAVRNESVGDITFEGGVRIREVHNGGSGVVRIDGIGNDDVLLVNESVGAMKVRRAETDSLTVINEGSGTISVEETTTTLLRVETQSVGDVTVRALDVAELSVENTGSGMVYLHGSADITDVTLDSVGDVDADVMSRVALVRNEGSGDASVTAWERADVTLESVGDVLVRGQPSQLIVRGDGSGDVLVER